MSHRGAQAAIADSALRMDEAVGNAVHRCGVALVTAVEVATRTPAAALGRDDLGVISTGSPADLVWLDDALSASATWVGGTLVWSRDDDATGAAARIGGPA